MSKKIRWCVLLLGVLIFILAGSYLFLYSQGIRIDINKWRLVKTGGFEIQVLSPSGADIYFNSKRAKSTGFLQNTLFIKNFLPQTYKVEIKKDGFYSWQKNLEVQESLVTQAKSIILFKQNPSFDVMAENVENFWLAPYQKKLLVFNQLHQAWSYSLIDASAKKAEQVILGQNSLDPKNPLPILEQWDEPQKRLLLKTTVTTATSAPDKLWIVNYSAFPQIEIFSQVIEKDCLEISFKPQTSHQVIYLKNNNLYSLDFKQKTASPLNAAPAPININQPVKPNKQLLMTKAVWFEIKDNNLYWLDQSGFLHKSSDQSLEKTEVLNKTSLELSGWDRFTVYNQSSPLLLLLNQNLHWSQNNDFVKIEQQFQGLDVSGDNSQALLWGNQELWLADKNQKPFTARFLNRFWKTPAAAFWLNKDYILFNIDDEIKISETDSRDYLNIYTLKSFKEPKLVFNGYDKKLYVLSQKVLYGSERLAP